MAERVLEMVNKTTVRKATKDSRQSTRDSSIKDMRRQSTRNSSIKDMLNTGTGEVYLQGAISFTLPKNHVAPKVYCSPSNPGAVALCSELNN
eukprot:3210133-Prymnesium_polylepis.1